MKSVWVVLAIRQTLSPSLATMQHVNSLANCTVFSSKEEAEKHAAKIASSSKAWNVMVRELPVHAKADTAAMPKVNLPEN